MRSTQASLSACLWQPCGAAQARKNAFRRGCMCPACGMWGHLMANCQKPNIVQLSQAKPMTNYREYFPPLIKETSKDNPRNEKQNSLKFRSPPKCWEIWCGISNFLFIGLARLSVPSYAKTSTLRSAQSSRLRIPPTILLYHPRRRAAAIVRDGYIWVDSGVVATIRDFLWEHTGELFSQRRKSIAQVYAH